MEVLSAFVTLAAVVALRWWISPRRQLLAAMRRAPATPLGRVEEDAPARVVGEAYPYEPLTAPLSGEPCAAYRIRVDRRASSVGVWLPLLDITRCAPLELRDGARALGIHPDDATLVPSTRHPEGLLFFVEPPEPLVALLHARGLPSGGWLRWIEETVPSGARVAAAGVGARGTHGELGLVGGPSGLLLCADPALLERESA